MVYVWGLPYIAPSYSDVMAYLLLSLVGTDFDPSNPFLYVTFIVFPTLLLIPRLSLYAGLAATIDKLEFLSVFWALFYSLTP